MAATKTKINYPSFFKIMLGDFSTQLGVPPAFSNNFKHTNCMLRVFTVSLRFDPGTSWKVTLERNREDGFYYFTRGWSKVVKDLHLAEGDFSVFYLVADDAFQVAVYDPTSLHKEIPRLSTSGERHGGTRVHVMNKGENKEVNVQKENPLCFEVTLSIFQLKSLTLPAYFVRSTRLWVQKKVVMIDPNGKKWSVVKQETKLAKYIKYGLITGWSDFIQGNGFAVGDTLKFKFVGGCNIRVKVVSVGAS